MKKIILPIVIALFFFSCEDEESAKKSIDPVSNAAAVGGVGQITVSWNNPSTADLELVELSYKDVDETQKFVIDKPEGKSTGSITVYASEIQTYQFSLVAVGKSGARSEAVTVPGQAVATTALNGLLSTVAIATYDNLAVKVTWSNPGQIAGEIVVKYFDVLAETDKEVRFDAKAATEGLIVNLMDEPTDFDVNVADGAFQCVQARRIKATPFDLVGSKVTKVLESMLVLPIKDGAYVFWDNTADAIPGQIQVKVGDNVVETFDALAVSEGQINTAATTYSFTMTVDGRPKTRSYNIPYLNTAVALIPKSQFQNAQFSDDTYGANASYPLERIWDGTINNRSNIWVSDHNPFPRYFTVSLGREAYITQIKVYPRLCSDYTVANPDGPYSNQHPFSFEFWGANNPDDDGTWDDWFLLGKYVTIAPTSITNANAANEALWYQAPNGTHNTVYELVSAADRRYAVEQGLDYYVLKSTETPAPYKPVTHIRMKIFENHNTHFGRTVNATGVALGESANETIMTEISFYGKLLE
jgi:hypothetical protein